MFFVKSRCLPYFIHSMLSVMQQIGCGLQICFDYRLNFDECFLVSSSAHALFEERKEEAFYQQRHL